MPKRGLNLWYVRDFLATTPSVRQPLFETSDEVGPPKSAPKSEGHCVLAGLARWWSGYGRAAACPGDAVSEHDEPRSFHLALVVRVVQTSGNPKYHRQEKEEHKDLLGPETARWGGGLPREGVVAEKFAPSLESLSSLGFEEFNLGCPGNFAGMSRTPGGVQKSLCRKKVRAHFSFPKSATGKKTLQT